MSTQSMQKVLSPLYGTDVERKVDARMKEFLGLAKKSNDEWFYELCFCLLAANSKSRTALAVQQELGVNGCLTYSFERIRDIIIKNKHRFHNTKAQRIIRARQLPPLKDTVQKLVRDQGVVAAREWLVANVYGFGYKEASHYLRNVGYFDCAILDRHVLQLLFDHGFITTIPPCLNKKHYLFIEKKFLDLAKKLNLSPAKLDFYFWYLRAGDVIK